MRPGWRVQALVGVTAGGVCTAAVIGLSGLVIGGTSPAPSGLAAPPSPAFRVPAATPLPAARYLRSWAPVVRATPAHARPSFSSPVIGQLAIATPEATANLVLTQGSVHSGRQIWVRALIPGLPGRTEGWIPRSALGGYHTVDTLLLVDLKRLTASLYADGRRVFEARIGIGASGSPTPAGVYYIRDRIQTLHSPLYGPLAFGTSVRSPVETEWPGGGFIGIHGTNQPGLIPGRVSHGCIRLRNTAILRLGRLMPVGTPLVIV